MLSVKTVNDLGDYVYPVKAISILKQHGKSAHESQLIDGFALNCTRASQAMPASVANAKIALLDFDLRVTKLKLGIQIIVSDPKELEAIRRREVDVTKERIMKIIAAGANVILTTKGIDDVCMKYMVEAGVIGVRRCVCARACAHGLRTAAKKKVIKLLRIEKMRQRSATERFL